MNGYKSGVLRAILFLPVCLWGHTVVASYCDLPSVQHIPLPLYFDRANSPTFSYAYQMVQKFDPDQPTLIFIPGGPGDTSISDLTSQDLYADFYFSLSGVPSQGWNVIFTDPRSTGCNYGDVQAFPDDSITTLAFAHDLIGLVTALNLKNYYLYGLSYGTVLATEMASIAESQGIGPQGVVLAGTVANAVSDSNLMFTGFTVKQWDLMKERLPESVLNRLGSAAAPLGLAETDWENDVNIGLRFGRVVENGNVWDRLYDQLMLLSSNTAADDQKFLASVQGMLKYWVDSSSQDEQNAEERVAVDVGCRELFPMNSEFQLMGGVASLRPTSDDCHGVTLQNSYDVTNWPIKANLYYFAGSNDPAVDYDIQQRAHLKAENHANRFFVTLPRGGHDLLGETLGDCSDAIWNSILHGGADLEGALWDCKDQPLLETFNAD